MTLEDFFTLTEMKDGFMSYNRVEEMISVMRRDKDCVVNVNEAARQWSSVASTLAATENRDSLDYFVRLNGLLFLDHWLQEAQKFCNDTCDDSVETLISLLLGALKKLPIDNKRSISSGIGETVKKLFTYKNFEVQERARALFSSWNRESDNYKDNQDTKEVGTLVEDRVKQTDGTVSAESWCLENPSCGNPVIERNIDGKATGNEHQESRSTEGSQHRSTGVLNSPDISNKDNTHSCLKQEHQEAVSRENTQDLCNMSNSCQGIISVIEETSTCPAEGNTSGGSCSILTSVEGKSSHISRLKDLTSDGKEADNGIGKRETSSGSASVSASSGSRSESVSPPDSISAQQPVMRPDVLSNSNVDDTKNCIEKTLPDSVDGDICILASALKSVAVEPGLLKQLQNGEHEAAYNVGGPCSDVLQNSSFEERNSDSVDDTNSENHDPETPDDVEQLSGESKLKAGYTYKTASAISSPEIDANFSELKTNSDLDFEYGFDDALEVARQVAKEAEREVVDYRKQFCSSSSEKSSEGRVLQPSSPDSINDEQDLTVGQSRDEPPVIQNVNGSTVSPNVEDHLTNTEYVEKAETCIQKDDSPQGTETLKKPADEGRINLCDFDLNELCAEEVDHAVVTFVSASKVVPTGVPKAPLHFEGELGWKGSAATSAFRPAYSSRTLDCGKPMSVVGSSQSSKQQRMFLDIDLNVTDGDADVACHPVMNKQVPVSSDLPSGESSVEVSSRRAQRLKLDLNSIGDNEDNPSPDDRMEERSIYHHPISSPSPASSSSSRQFPPRNIDLNGNPSFFDDSHDRQPTYGKCSTTGGFKVDDPVVSIMGARVAINRPAAIPQTQSFLPSGRRVESPVGAVFSRSENGYMHPPPSLFGYNAYGMGSPVSLPPAIYGHGPVPCMVDSRGAPVLQQMIPSSSDAPPSQMPYFMSMTNPMIGMNGVPRPSFDLNSGLTMGEAERRENGGGFRQVFIQGQGMLMEEMRSASQHMGPGLGMKRKEPDNGWDLYPVGYKNQPPWF